MKKLVNIYKLFMLLFLSFYYSPDSKAQIWTLDNCLTTAKEYNKTLQIAKNNQQISHSKHSEAKGSLWPKVNAISDYKYFTDLPYQLLPAAVFGGAVGQFKEAQFGVPHNISAQVQLAMPLYQPQAIGAVKLTALAEEAAAMQYRKSEEQLFYDVTTVYYAAQLVKFQLKMVEKNLDNTGKLLGTIRLLKAEQMAKSTDVAKIELQQQQLETQHELTRTRYAQLLNNLKLLMGFEPQKSIDVSSELVLDETIADFANKNTDIQVVRIQNKLLNRELITLRTTALPSVNIIGAYGTSGFGYDQQPNNFLKFFPISFVGLQVSMPLFNGGAIHQKTKQKRLEIQNNELQTSLIQDQNIVQISNLKALKNTNFRQIELTKKQQELALHIYEQALLQQKEGMATLTDVLMADGAFRETQQTHFAAIVEYMKAVAELKKITGNFSY